MFKPDVVVVDPVVELKPDRRGPVEQGECLGVGGTGEPDVVVVESVVELKPLKPDRRKTHLRMFLLLIY